MVSSEGAKTKARRHEAKVLGVLPSGLSKGGAGPGKEMKKKKKSSYEPARLLEAKLSGGAHSFTPY